MSDKDTREKDGSSPRPNAKPGEERSFKKDEFYGWRAQDRWADSYVACCAAACSYDSVFVDFKSHPLFGNILEHVTMLDQIPISRIQMALGYQVPYPPFAMQGPDEAVGGQQGGAPGGQAPAIPGEPAAPGQNFEKQQSNASPVPEA